MDQIPNVGHLGIFPTKRISVSLPSSEVGEQIELPVQTDGEDFLKSPAPRLGLVGVSTAVGGEANDNEKSVLKGNQCLASKYLPAMGREGP